MSRRTVCGVLAACLVFSQLTGCDLNDPAVQETRKKQTIDIMLSYLRAR